MRALRGDKSGDAISVGPASLWASDTVTLALSAAGSNNGMDRARGFFQGLPVPQIAFSEVDIRGPRRLMMVSFWRMWN